MATWAVVNEDGYVKVRRDRTTVAAAVLGQDGRTLRDLAVYTTGTRTRIKVADLLVALGYR